MSNDSKNPNDDPGTNRVDLLGSLLKNVSRSFYLTLRVLPGGLREPVGLAYLLARAADTVADTELIAPERRLELLLGLRARVNGSYSAIAQEIASELSAQQSNPHERVLLQSLDPALDLLDACNAHDRFHIRHVVTTLTEGMELDLRTFPNETSGHIGALKTGEELERYTYLVAGCVGDFWTRMTMAHEPALREWDPDEMSACGIRFGKALQYTNVLRDVPKDLRIGRCYFPKELLAKHGLVPNDLLDPKNATRARLALADLIRIALTHFDEARRYLLSIPPSCTRLRLACLWPILIGLPTLEKLGQNADWLDPKKPSKITRAQVQRTLLLSLPAVGSNRLLNCWIEKQLNAVKTIFEN
ncbi:MAG: phytoene/squalene synthase family protein [Planctomycetota bacterium]